MYNDKLKRIHKIQECLEDYEFKMPRYIKRTIDNWESYIVDIETGEEYGQEIDRLLEILNKHQDDYDELLSKYDGAIEIIKKYYCNKGSKNPKELWGNELISKILDDISSNYK